LPETIRPEIILLDDAFQHRYVTPSLSILLTDYNRLFYKDALLPAGRLRESKKNKKRAQIVIVTKCPPALTSINYRLLLKEMKLFPLQELFSTSYQYKGLLPVFQDNNPIKKENLERLKKEAYSILLVAGLANPTLLIDYLHHYTPDLQPLIYPDHHFFTPKDGREIAGIFGKINNSNKIIITSEKDAVRLLGDASVIPEEIKSSFFYIPIEIQFNFNQEQLFIQKIENHVVNFTRNRILA
jgi:tetraacyldisaccharide 4'-kinase